MAPQEVPCWFVVPGHEAQTGAGVWSVTLDRDQDSWIQAHLQPDDQKEAAQPRRNKQTGLGLFKRLWKEVGEGYVRLPGPYPLVPWPHWFLYQCFHSPQHPQDKPPPQTRKTWPEQRASQALSFFSVFTQSRGTKGPGFCLFLQSPFSAT